MVVDSFSYLYETLFFATGYDSCEYMIKFQPFLLLIGELISACI